MAPAVTYVVPRVLSDFLGDHPNVKASIHTRSSQKMVEWVSEGQIDVAFAMLTLDNPSVERSVLMSIEMVAAIPREHALARLREITPGDLDGVDYVSLGVSDHAREILDKLLAATHGRGSGGRPGERSIVPNERAECALPAVAIQLAEHGVGVAIVDRLTAGEHRGDNLVFRPFRPRATMSVWVLKPKMRPRSQLTDLFIADLKDALECDQLSRPPANLFGI